MHLFENHGPFKCTPKCTFSTLRASDRAKTTSRAIQIQRKVATRTTDTSESKVIGRKQLHEQFMMVKRLRNMRPGKGEDGGTGTTTEIVLSGLERCQEK